MPMSHRNMDPLQNFDTPSSGGANNRENRKRYSNRYNRRSSNKNWRNNNSAYKKKHLINQKVHFDNYQDQYPIHTDENKSKDQNAKNIKQCFFDELPDNIVSLIFKFLDPKSLQILASLSPRLKGILFEDEARRKKRRFGEQLLEELPTEILVHLFSYVSRNDLGKLSQTCKRFRDIAQTDSLWVDEAHECLVTNTAACINMGQRTAPAPITSAKERVRIARNWTQGHYEETKLAVQDIRYMPRIELEQSSLWVSWGNKIWSHPRHADGTVGRMTTRVLKGHTDDVSRFVVKDGYLISGGRDKTLQGWNSETGEFLFAKRYCHGSEVSAVDIIRSSGLLVTGSRDRTVKIWNLDPYSASSGGSSGPDSSDERPSYERASTFPSLSATLNFGDRIWSLAANPYEGNRVVVGTAGLMGIPSLRVVDLGKLCSDPSSGLLEYQEMGQTLKNGAGMLDLQWQTPTSFLSCGHDTCTRLWDTRMNACVRTWEEPFDHAIYCLATDGNWTLVCGTARHGMVRLWDMRHSKPVQLYYSKHPFSGQSSPVYSVAFDQKNLYVALDQCLNLLSFSGQITGSKSIISNYSTRYR